MANDKQLHSALGGSVMGRIIGGCPGSYNLLKTLPDEAFNVSEYAAEGSAAHTLAARALRQPGIPDVAVGFKMQQDGYEVEVTQEMLDAVDVYVDYVHSLLAAYKIPSSYMGVEVEVAIPAAADEHEPLFGTADSLIHVPYKLLHVTDYKHGKGKKVYVQNNKQLRYYALGAYYGLSPDMREELQTVRLSIVQPRCTVGSPISEDEITVAELLRFEREDLRPAIQAAHEPDAPLTPGDHCKDTFCPAKLTCPAVRQRVHEVASIKFTETSVKAGNLTNPQTLSDEHLVFVIENANLLEDFIKRCQEQAAFRATTRGLPGYKMVPGVGRRRFVVGAAARLEQLVADAQGVKWPKGDFSLLYFEPKLLTPAPLEKALKAAKLKIDITPLVERPKTAPKLVKESDARETRGAIEAFTKTSKDACDII